MGDNKETTTSISAPSNPAVNNTLTNLLGSLGGVSARGMPTFDKSLYTGMGELTTGGIANTADAAAKGAGGLNDAYGWAKGTLNAQGYNPALTQALGGAQRFMAESQQNAPGYAKVRSDTINDTTRDIASSFLTDGRYGSSVMGDAAGEGIASAVGRMDMQNNENRLGRMLSGSQAIAGIGQTAMNNAAGAAGAMPGLYDATLQPGRTQIGLGQLQDANALATRQGEADLHERTYGADWTNLGKATSIFSQLAGTGGNTQSVSSPAAPWWMNAASLAGQFI